jgi:hypothetical protein
VSEAVDLSKLTKEEIKELSVELGISLQEAIDSIDSIITETNKVFNVYGIDIKTELVFLNKKNGRKLT